MRCPDHNNVCKTETGEIMDTKELKKLLAGVGVASLLAVGGCVGFGSSG
jgi:hypothetical protein